jgi:hypothetical protein
MDERAMLEQENAALRQQIATMVELVARLDERRAALLPTVKRRRRKAPGSNLLLSPVVGAAAQGASDPRPEPPGRRTKAKRRPLASP